MSSSTADSSPPEAPTAEAGEDEASFDALRVERWPTPLSRSFGAQLRAWHLASAAAGLTLGSVMTMVLIDRHATAPWGFIAVVTSLVLLGTWKVRGDRRDLTLLATLVAVAVVVPPIGVAVAMPHARAVLWPCLGLLPLAGVGAWLHLRVVQSARHSANPLRDRYPTMIAEQHGVQFVVYWPHQPLPRGGIAHVVGVFQNATDAERVVALSLEEGSLPWQAARQLEISPIVGFELHGSECAAVVVPFRVLREANEAAHLHVTVVVERTGEHGRRVLPWRAPHSRTSSLARTRRGLAPWPLGSLVYRGRRLPIAGQVAAGDPEPLPTAELWPDIDVARWPPAPR